MKLSDTDLAWTLLNCLPDGYKKKFQSKLETTPDATLTYDFVKNFAIQRFERSSAWYPSKDPPPKDPTPPPPPTDKGLHAKNPGKPKKPHHKGQQEEGKGREDSIQRGPTCFNCNKKGHMWFDCNLPIAADVKERAKKFSEEFRARKKNNNKKPELNFATLAMEPNSHLELASFLASSSHPLIDSSPLLFLPTISHPSLPPPTSSSLSLFDCLDDLDVFTGVDDFLVDDNLVDGDLDVCLDDLGSEVVFPPFSPHPLSHLKLI